MSKNSKTVAFLTQLTVEHPFWDAAIMREKQVLYKFVPGNFYSITQEFPSTKQVQLKASGMSGENSGITFSAEDILKVAVGDRVHLASGHRFSKEFKSSTLGYEISDIQAVNDPGSSGSSYFAKQEIIFSLKNSTGKIRTFKSEQIIPLQPEKHRQVA